MPALSSPPTVSGRIPVIGHALQFLRDPIPLLQRGYQEHGSVFSLQLGNKPAVVLLGPDNNRFFFTQTDKLLSIREAYPFFIKMFHERFYFFADLEELAQAFGLLVLRAFPKMVCQATAKGKTLIRPFRYDNRAFTAQHGRYIR